MADQQIRASGRTPALAFILITVALDVLALALVIAWAVTRPRAAAALT